MNGKDIRDLLKEDSALVDLVGERIYVDRIADNATTPHIKLIQIAGENVQRLGGGNTSLDLWQIEIRSETLSVAVAVRDLVKARLNGYTSTINGYTFFTKTALLRGYFEQDTRFFMKQIDLEVKYGSK